LPQPSASRGAAFPRRTASLASSIAQCDQPPVGSAAAGDRPQDVERGGQGQLRRHDWWLIALGYAAGKRSSSTRKCGATAGRRLRQATNCCSRRRSSNAGRAHSPRRASTFACSRRPAATPERSALRLIGAALHAVAADDLRHPRLKGASRKWFGNERPVPDSR
jgi:hypothetical protein